jgi:hypothetical protein
MYVCMYVCINHCVSLCVPVCMLACMYALVHSLYSCLKSFQVVRLGLSLRCVFLITGQKERKRCWRVPATALALLPVVNAIQWEWEHNNKSIM